MSIIESLKERLADATGGYSSHAITSILENQKAIMEGLVILLEEIPCGGCDGRGWVRDYFDGPNTNETRPCGHCNGSGMKYGKLETPVEQ